MKNQFQRLTDTQRNEFLKSLQNMKQSFYGRLSTREIVPVDFELKEDEKPICSISYPVPKVHK